MTQRPIKYAVQVVSALVAVKPGAVACINASINQIWSSLFHSMLSGYME